MPPAFSPTPIGPPPNTGLPPQAGQPASPQSGGNFDLGMVAGQQGQPQSATDPLMANEGILSQMQALSLAITSGEQMLTAIAGQFPNTAPFVRDALQALQTAGSSIIDILTAVISQSQEAQQPAPRLLG